MSASLPTLITMLSGRLENSLGLVRSAWFPWTFSTCAWIDSVQTVTHAHSMAVRRFFISIFFIKKGYCSQPGLWLQFSRGTEVQDLEKFLGFPKTGGTKIK